ncbi:MULTISPECIES: TRAP transporter small permease [unclassified Chelatococcus]|uniref:TRAP transporter small permease subunit n=1 Tax=unclassified Chelatococcus TaxID=2638111 RepID=UPI001BCD00F1|nr:MULTISPECIES: TRAP transporter small permease [unclassified Chelatococcus]CAH1655971.1 conserved membrane hypothetical protein [Hyphomicrobiales bacterium]MBS7742526.1 TRAP transporter small permease [Chelatococcus sp. HY11]MBX3542356.1 TRAP transporter small permease [Chelatococcus sp.]MCO5075426.1 TRAP transporter small permease [Chelatococcus sp.]CAH1695697.1 conserved membrane hypothetical protein [Hyphomicrobiales bacterium]
MSIDGREATAASEAGIVERIFAGGVLALGSLGTILILVLAGLIIADVIGREMFGHAVPGVPELVAMSMVSIVFLQLAYAVRAERLTRNGSFIDKLCQTRPVIGHGIEAIFSLAGAVVFALIVLTTWRYFLFAWTSNQYFGGVAGFFVPVWPVKAVTIIGSTVISIQFILRFWRHLGLARDGGARQ